MGLGACLTDGKSLASVRVIHREVQPSAKPNGMTTVIPLTQLQLPSHSAKSSVSARPPVQ